VSKYLVTCLVSVDVVVDAAETGAEAENIALLKLDRVCRENSLLLNDEPEIDGTISLSGTGISTAPILGSSAFEDRFTKYET